MRGQLARIDNRFEKFFAIGIFQKLESTRGFFYDFKLIDRGFDRTRLACDPLQVTECKRG